MSKRLSTRLREAVEAGPPESVKDWREVRFLMLRAAERLAGFDSPAIGREYAHLPTQFCGTCVGFSIRADGDSRITLHERGGQVSEFPADEVERR